MLELKGITREYHVGDTTVRALKGIDMKFRNNEFVSILGPSGCGKTTTLNIIGGLDQYTSGDLIINGKSTKDFKDKDWDTYRNHSIGFVFQSYQLIPHQSVLRNVEIALTISGVSKAERRRRAIKALEDVGLGDQIHKHPREMSGGQMQRVAIARALVGNPDILLADEPTGALDTKTGHEVMEILKEVARDRLVIMVTHNPELAEQYSTRIIRMMDGQVIDDSNPLTEKDLQIEQTHDKAEREKAGKEKKPSMSLGTSFGLSGRNLISKKGRTALTTFAGSIGIIGISLVLAISQGMSSYIDAIQEETLASYPLTIQRSETDLSSMMSTFMGSAESLEEHDNDAVYKKAALYDMASAFANLETTENDLKSFKTYVEEQRDEEDSLLHDAVSAVQYTYDLDLLVYTENVDGTILRSDTMELMQNMMMEYIGVDMGAMSDATSSILGMDMTSMASGMMGISSDIWQEMIPGDNGDPISDMIYEQYDVVYGSWPNDYNEVVLVLDENNELDDITLYALGLESEDEVTALIEAAMNNEEIEGYDTGENWTYEDICNTEFHTILGADCYSYDEDTGLYVDLRETDAGLQYLYDNGLVLNVTGIIKPKEDASATLLSGGIAYTSQLTEYVIEKGEESDAVAAQLADPTTDIFTGLKFSESTGSIADETKETILRDYFDELDTAEKAAVYIQIQCLLSDDELAAMTEEQLAGVSRADMEEALTTLLAGEMGMSEDDVAGYLTNMSDDELTDTYSQLLATQIQLQYAQSVTEQMATMDPNDLAAALDAESANYTTEECAAYYDAIMTFSESTYEDNLTELGYVDLDDPATINLYASSFEDKDVITDAINEYNEGRDELEQITYTDYIGLMMSSITTIINAVTYVLVAFVAISLIVSCIMIAVITLISVQERTREIGILRAIGASKGAVSTMFNAETVLIGLLAGLFGIIVTYILCFPINGIIHGLTGIDNLKVALPISSAIILVVISVVLNLISGFVPSRSAAKKDPVVALRTE